MAKSRRTGTQKTAKKAARKPATKKNTTPQKRATKKSRPTTAVRPGTKSTRTTTKKTSKVRKAAKKVASKAKKGVGKAASKVRSVTKKVPKSAVKSVSKTTSKKTSSKKSAKTPAKAPKKTSAKAPQKKAAVKAQPKKSSKSAAAPANRTPSRKAPAKKPSGERTPKSAKKAKTLRKPAAKDTTPAEVGTISRSQPSGQPPKKRKKVAAPTDSASVQLNRMPVAAHPDAALTARQVKVLHEKLVEERARKLAELERHMQEALGEPNVMPDETDMAQRSTEQAYLIRFADKERKLLNEIERALDKLRVGDYGVCEGTEEPIGFKRLELRPWTRYSVAYKEQIERERSQHRR